MKPYAHSIEQTQKEPKAMVDLLERIDVMLEQEARSYTTQDYLAPSFQSKLASLKLGSDSSFFPQESATDTASSSSSGSSSSGISEIWRERICEWSYQVVDHFDYSREVVGISMHYLDRYLATRPVSKKEFQLAAMTALFLAIKLHEPGRLSMSSMIELSRGYFNPAQMAAMEMSILRALCWHVHPPTSFSFVKHMVLLLPQVSLPTDTRHDLLELSRFLTELSVIDYYFVIDRPSVIAVAALLNAVEEIPGISKMTATLLVAELEKLSHFEGASCEELTACRSRLRLLYAQGGYSHPSVSNEARPETVSPVCVSYGCDPYVLAGAGPAVEQAKSQYTTDFAPCAFETFQGDEG